MKTKKSLPPDERKGLVIIVACGCHNSRGMSVDENGTVTETSARARCAKHLKEGHPFLDWDREREGR